VGIGENAGVPAGERQRRMSETNVPAVFFGRNGRQKSKKPARKQAFKFGSSDWTRTSSTSPVITAFVKYSHIFTNIFTIIIVFLW
jgi:hypothetical protein